MIAPGIDCQRVDLRETPQVSTTEVLLSLLPRADAHDVLSKYSLTRDNSYLFDVLRNTQNISRYMSDMLSPLECSRIIRPEQFITPEVSGLTVPVIRGMNGKPMPVWKTYLRWSDGRRECVELNEVIPLPDGSNYWIHPTPGS